MSLSTLQGIGAYQKALDRKVDKGPVSDGPPAFDFGKLVENLVSDAGKATRTAETTSMQAVAGKTSLVDVVTSVQAAETQLETLVAVRDRVVAAYQDIMRMTV